MITWSSIDGRGRFPRVAKSFCRASSIDSGRIHCAAHRSVQNVAALEVPRFADAVPRGRLRRRVRQDRVKFAAAPDIEATLSSLRVGVFGGIDSAARRREVSQHVAQRLVDDLAVTLLPGDLPGVEVEAGEGGLVIEHFFEMRHLPCAIDRVAAEAAAEMVVDATRGHRVERGERHLAHAGVTETAGVEGEFEDRCLRELWCRVRRPGARRRRARRSVRRRCRPGRAARGGDADGSVACNRLATALGERQHVGVDLDAPVRPGVGDRVEHVQKPGRAVAGGLREVRAAVKGPALWGREHRERPSAVSGDRLHRLEVDRVEIGPFFAVDLDRDEGLVQPLRDLVVLEAFVRHHMAPVARRVADRDEKGPVELAGAFEGLVAERSPVDGVLGVLTQIGACLIFEGVHRRCLARSSRTASRRTFPIAVRGRVSTTTTWRGAEIGPSVSATSARSSSRTGRGHRVPR